MELQRSHRWIIGNISELNVLFQFSTTDYTDTVITKKANVLQFYSWLPETEWLLMTSSVALSAFDVHRHGTVKHYFYDEYDIVAHFLNEPLTLK